MSASDVLHPDGSDYDAFLQAELGEDRSGSAVTVLSALARLGLEPWTEAKELAGLGKADAEARLTAHFASITDVPAIALAGGNKAAKLVSLLPRRAAPVFSKARQRHDAKHVQLPLFRVGLALFCVVVIVRIFYLAQMG